MSKFSQRDPNEKKSNLSIFFKYSPCPQLPAGIFVGSKLLDFKIQIEIDDLDFETGIWAETYH